MHRFGATLLRLVVLQVVIKKDRPPLLKAAHYGKSPFVRNSEVTGTRLRPLQEGNTQHTRPILRDREDGKSPMYTELRGVVLDVHYHKVLI